MTLIQKTWKKIRSFWKKPIRVFCFHQVSDVFDPSTMWECDWTQTDTFKDKIASLKKEYTFIPLTEAYRHIVSDRFRLKKYAALTADDGWASLYNIIPWLADQRIPITLFLNPLFFDGINKQSRETEKMLSLHDVKRIVAENSPYVSIASHGWSHKDCLSMALDGFSENVEKAESVLTTIDGYIPFYAFTFGRYKDSQLKYLEERGLIPVIMNGEKNYTQTYISRECIDEGVK